MVLGSRPTITIVGLSFQPSELVKVTLVLYLASYFARRETNPQYPCGWKIPANALIPPFIVIFVFAAIILLQNDYSTAIFFHLELAMLVVRVRLVHFLLVSLLTVPLGFLLLHAGMGAEASRVP